MATPNFFRNSKIKSYDHIFTSAMPILFLGGGSSWGTLKDEWVDIEPFLLEAHKELKIVFNLDNIFKAYLANEDRTHRTICHVLDFLISEQKPETCVLMFRGDIKTPNEVFWSRLVTTLIHPRLPTHLKLDFYECRLINNGLGFSVFEKLRQIFENGHLSKLTALEINLNWNGVDYLKDPKGSGRDLVPYNLATVNRFLGVVHYGPSDFILHLSGHAFDRGENLLLIHLAGLIANGCVPARFGLDLLYSSFSEPAYEALLNAYRSPDLPAGCEIDIGYSMRDISPLFIHSQYEAYRTWQPKPLHHARLFFGITPRASDLPDLPEAEYAECKEELEAIQTKINSL